MSHDLTNKGKNLLLKLGLTSLYSKEDLPQKGEEKLLKIMGFDVTPCF